MSTQGATGNRKILYCYFMPVCIIVKNITPMRRGDLIHYCTRLNCFITNPFDDILSSVPRMELLLTVRCGLMQNRKFQLICSILVSKCSARSN